MFLTAWYPSDKDSMFGLFVKRHAAIMTQSNQVSVLYVCGSFDCQKKIEINTEIEDDIFTIRVIYKKYKILPFLNQLLKLIYFFKAHFQGFKVLSGSKGMPDIVHVNILTNIGLFALYLKKRYNIPYVITEHWSRYLPIRNEFNNPLEIFITRLITYYSNGISTVSLCLKEAMIAKGINHKRFYIISNGVDFILFRNQQNNISKDRKVFSHISCFDDKAKNITGIVKSIHKLALQRNDFVCLLVGDGKDREKIQRLVDELNIQEFVKFAGVVEGIELVNVYNQADFTIMFSNYENMPVVIPESFACGKPVIAARVGGIPEIITEQNGILVNPGDIDSFVNALNDMLDNFRKYDANTIRQLAEARFSHKAVEAQLEHLYAVKL